MHRDNHYRIPKLMCNQQIKPLPSICLDLKNKFHHISWDNITFKLLLRPRYLKSFLLSSLFIFLMSVFICCSQYTPANAFRTEVLPNEIKAGDAFIVKITSETTSHNPIAYISNKRLHFSSCGETCFIAIGAVTTETKPGNYTINIKVGHEKRNLTLVVNPAHFPTLNLTLPEDKVFLSSENLKRVKKEEKLLRSLFQRVTEKLWDGSFILPLENDFSTAFGAKRILNQKRISIHRGLDITGKMGEEVKAANHGRIVFSEELFFGGKTVIIDHGQGIYTIYMHLSKFNVQQNAIIKKGDIIGFVGATGRATGPHLHFGVKVLNTNTNPVSFVKLDLP